MSHTAMKGAGLGENPRVYHLFRVTHLPINLLTTHRHNAPGHHNTAHPYIRIEFLQQQS